MRKINFFGFFEPVGGGGEKEIVIARRLWYSKYEVQVMDGNRRRQQISRELERAKAPVSAAAFAEKFGVSRQVIVGDIALLRAEGHDIIATARGYMTQAPAAGKYVGTVVCKHSPEETRAELEAIVAAGGTVVEVIVSHRYYGDLTGQLNIASVADVDAFIQRTEGKSGHLLLELTDGVHLHTVTCAGRAAFEGIERRLAELGYLYSPVD
ncbi:MAG: transcription repressor NadR [Clostridiales Family XIII bacterium]|jgi:transcriptional regulator of NAD metabolism|nr:transcription repressor NadR [Clostridiales Family XIII bacterium]